MSERRQDRNREKLENTADMRPHETQDLRPDYEERPEDGRAGERTNRQPEEGQRDKSGNK